jgi:8-oxo-dGTP pyrophosphatase MutT (NUDIX family)
VAHLRIEIPRPNGSLPGAPASWERLPESERAGITVDEVWQALAAPAGLTTPLHGPLNVTVAELPPQADQRPAAVLCLLFDRAGEANVVLTRRPAHLRSHAGEVCFPGGRLRRGELPVEAALREVNEEIGVAAEDIEVIGQLTPLTTTRSPAVVDCFVGTLSGLTPEGPVFVPDPNEVDKVFWVPLAQLAATGAYHEELWPSRQADGGTPFRAVPFFRLDEDTVWGATGRLLAELLGAVLGRRGQSGAPEDAGGALERQSASQEGTLGKS